MSALHHTCFCCANLAIFVTNKNILIAYDLICCFFGSNFPHRPDAMNLPLVPGILYVFLHKRLYSNKHKKTVTTRFHECNLDSKRVTGTHLLSVSLNEY